ncbi:MAG: hypothetical protein COA47_02075 [Robiginitomaculum sp.]|nr:MAG: hypothetical protein COA47_02075 [Robiginitomaculum sp.]
MIKMKSPKPSKSAKNRSARTRERILNAAKKVLVGVGAKKVTIRQIAKEAEVSPGLVMQYFDTKAMLILEIFHEGNRPVNEYLRESLGKFDDPYEMLFGTIRNHLERNLKNRELTRQVMAFAWTWGEEEEAQFEPNTSRVLDVVIDAMTDKFYPGYRPLVATAVFTVSGAYAGVLRMGLHKNWSQETFLTALKPAISMVIRGLEAEILLAEYKPDPYEFFI